MAMSAKDAESAISILMGQVHSLFMICQALAQSHPDIDDLISRFEYATQEGLAAVEMLPLKNEDLIDGYQFFATEMRGVLQAAAAKKKRT
jgi:hypothetical protein